MSRPFGSKNKVQAKKRARRTPMAAAIVEVEVAKLPTPVNAIQHGGRHYKGMGIEPWDYIANNELGFFEGNAIKYLTRWRAKGGVEDLKKAEHYVQKLIEVETARGTK